MDEVHAATQAPAVALHDLAADMEDAQYEALVMFQNTSLLILASICIPLTECGAEFSDGICAKFIIITGWTL